MFATFFDVPVMWDSPVWVLLLLIIYLLVYLRRFFENLIKAVKSSKFATFFAVSVVKQICNVIIYLLKIFEAITT